MKRLYDTNYFINNLEELKLIKNENIFVSMITIKELDNIKNSFDKKNSLKKACRLALNFIRNNKNVKVINFNLLNLKKILINYNLNESVNDDLIIAEAILNNMELVTLDTGMSLKAEALGSPVKFKKQEKIEELKEIYSGRDKVKISNKDFQKLIKNKKIELRGRSFPINCILKINDSVDTIWNGFEAVLIEPKYKSYFGLNPKTDEQRIALYLLEREDIKIISFSGRPGTSKTITALSYGLETMLKNKNGGKLYIAKPPVSLSKRLETGFKPGSEVEKGICSLVSYTSNIEVLMRLNKKYKFEKNGKEQLLKWLDDDIIRYVSLEDILGLSLSDNDLVILDEAELLNKEELHAVISRGGRIILCSDINQGAGNKIDFDESGILHLIEVLKPSNLVAHLTLETILRSETVKQIEKFWYSDPNKKDELSIV